MSSAEYAAPYEACVYTAEYERDFIKHYLGPLMKSTHPDVNIMIYDHNRDHVHLWAQTIYSDQEAAKYVGKFTIITMFLTNIIHQCFNDCYAHVWVQPMMMHELDALIISYRWNCIPLVF